MRNTTRRTARAALVALTATCAMAFGASTASATSWNEVPLGSLSAPATLEGTLTVQWANAPQLIPPIQCPITTRSGSTAQTIGPPTAPVAAFSGYSQASCSNGKLFGLELSGRAFSEPGGIVYQLDFPGMGDANNHPFYGTFGVGAVYTPAITAVRGTVTNGTGGTKTKITFSNAVINRTGYETPLKISGQLEVKTPAGGTFTVAP